MFIAIALPFPMAGVPRASFQTTVRRIGQTPRSRICSEATHSQSTSDLMNSTPQSSRDSGVQNEQSIIIRFPEC